MKNTDYLIWIGESYSKVLCGKHTTCAIPFSESKSHCYMHEAEWRGCCRKVPMIPPLAITGKTRIFLAHKDGLKSKEKGRLFGYFILDSIEVIKGVKEPLSVPVQNYKNIKTSSGTITKAQCWNGARIENPDLIDDRCPNIEPCPECEEGEVRTKDCDDGNKIVTHRCENGRWIKTDNKCEDGIPDGCKEGEFLFEPWDGGFIVSHYCDDGQWIKTNAKPPVNNSPEQTMFETERACSLRLKPGSIYFVDALTRDITTQFRINLKRENYTEKYRSAKTNSEKETLILEARKLFVNTVETVKKSRAICTLIPDTLKGKAELRGEFVFFNKRILFDRYPNASFLGILRVDGNKIIDQVADDQHRINICFCDSDWKSRLIQECRTNRAFIDRFLKSFIKITKEELKCKEELKIPGLGKFSAYLSQPKNGINPSTGMPIKIPAKKRVRFKAYENLKSFDKLNSEDCP